MQCTRSVHTAGPSPGRPRAAHRRGAAARCRSGGGAAAAAAAATTVAADSTATATATARPRPRPRYVRAAARAVYAASACLGSGLGLGLGVGVGTGSGSVVRIGVRCEHRSLSRRTCSAAASSAPLRCACAAGLSHERALESHDGRTRGGCAPHGDSPADDGSRGGAERVGHRSWVRRRATCGRLSGDAPGVAPAGAPLVTTDADGGHGRRAAAAAAAAEAP